MRRTQDHLAEPPAGRLADLAASLHRFQVVKDEIHGLVAPREDGVADETCSAPLAKYSGWRRAADAADLVNRIARV